MKKLMTVLFLAAIPCCWAQIPGTNIAVVDGITNTNIAAAVNYFANKSEQGGVVWDYIPYEDVLKNPFQQNTAIKLFLGTGKHATVCGRSNINCLVLEVPWVLPAGTQIHGSGRVDFLGDASTGTMFTIGTLFPAPLGPSPMPTLACNPTGGNLTGGSSPIGNFYFVVAQYNNVNTNTSGQATPGIGLHSSEFSCNLSAVTSLGSVAITAPAANSNALGSATEWYIFGTSGFSGTVNTGGATGGCPANCVAFATGNNFAQSQPLDLAPGVPICIGSNTVPCPTANLFHILQINNATTLTLMESPGSLSGATYYSSLGAYQLLFPTTNGVCGTGGTIDPQGCLLAGNFTVKTLAGAGQPPLPVDVSNCMFYMGGGNSSTITFDTFMENFSINLTNGETNTSNVLGPTSPTPYINSPSCAFYVNTAQEEGYLREFNISGASQQSYGVFANSAPNFSIEDAITGGGPNGYFGNISCTSATPAVCTVSGTSDPVGNWWGNLINITNANMCPAAPSGDSGHVCRIATINSPTVFTLTTQVSVGGVSNMPYCMGSNMATTNCLGSSLTTNTTNQGNFIPYVFDGTVNPNVSGMGANGTARLMKNVSISSKSGAYNPYLVDIRGPNASVLFAATHMEENPNTGNDCVYITDGANVTVKGDKFECPNATLHRDATAGQGSVENILNSAGVLFEDDQIVSGTGNGCGNNCLLKNPATSTPGSHGSYVNFSEAAAPIFAAWGFPKAATSNAGNLECVFTSPHVGDCGSTTANARAVGIGLAAETSTAFYQFAGIATVNSSAPAIWQATDVVCSDPSNPAFSVDNGTAGICPVGMLQVGVVYLTDTASTTSHQVMLRMGSPTPISTEMMTGPQNGLTSQTALTNLSFVVSASRKYQMGCTLYAQVSAAAPGVNISVTGPGSPTSVNVSLSDPNSASVVKAFNATAFSTTIGGTTSTTATTIFPITVTMGLINGASAGTVQLLAGPGGTGTISIAADSFCSMTAQ